MFERIIVPYDGSDEGWRAVSVGDRLAVHCDARLELLQVLDPATADEDEFEMRRMLEKHPTRSAAPLVTFLPVRDSVAATIAEHFVTAGSAALVMSSHGRGRSEALVGSVTSEVLALTFGPVVVVGPASATDWTAGGGDLVVPVDGSELSESALGIGVAWGIGLGLRPWVVTVAEPDAHVPADVVEGSYPARLAGDLARLSGRPVEFEVLHGDEPAREVADFATRTDARLIVASTHGRTGLARLRLGSVAAEIVRRAPCPVVLSRPPDLARIEHTAR